MVQVQDSGGGGGGMVVNKPWYSSWNGITSTYAEVFKASFGALGKIGATTLDGATQVVSTVKSGFNAGQPQPNGVQSVGSGLKWALAGGGILAFLLLVLRR
jgi:hypothetical protein